jgi:4-amino-4-deoxy-L-arabinose transferase-like glycosyltransferase
MPHAAMTGPVAGAPARTGLGLSARDAALVLVLLLGMAAVLAFAWVGYLGSDDVTYATGAYGWLRQFPYVGGHGTIRYLITWPIALSFVAFGEGEFQLILPTIGYFAALIAVTYLCMARLLDRATAVVAAILVMTLPLFAVQATTASADITELTFIVASVWLFYVASTSARPFPLLFASGAAAGLAWLTRETAVALLLFYGLSFLAGYRIKRAQYFVMGAGFFAVWGCELAYLYAMTGNPLYRIFISLHHDSTVTRAVDVAGNLFVHPAINPLVMLLVNQEFAVFFWIAIPVIVLLLAKRVLPDPYAEIARLWSLLAITWFLFFAVNSSLLPLNPRYVAPTAYGAAIAVAIFLRWLWLERRFRAAAIVFGAIVAANFAAIHVENRDYMFGERALADFVGDGGRTVRTDPDTAHRALQLLEWQGTEQRVVAGAPAPGQLYLYNPIRAGFPSRLVKPEDAPRYRPVAAWEIVWQSQPRPKLAGRVLKALGLDRFVPEGLMRRLYLPHPGVTVYRVPAP